MSFEDLPLSRPPEPPPERVPSHSSTSRWLIVGAGVVIVGALLTLWWMSRAQPITVAPAPTSAVDTAQGSRRPQRQSVELPTLADSDTMLRDLVGSLSRNPLLARLLATRGLVRGVTLAVVQVGDGKTPAVPLAVMRPSTRLEIAGAASGRVEPANYARWDAATAALQSIPAADAAQVYVNVKDLFDEAYRELGYPDADFDQAIAKAIRMLAATPPATADLVLLRREGYFEHTDPALQSLPPVQKQLLLTGPANRVRIMSWLRQLAATLELRINEESGF